MGLTVDNNLNFDTHLTDLCQKAGSKLSALTRVFRFLNLDKRRILIKAFFESQFKYCPLAWMFVAEK